MREAFAGAKIEQSAKKVRARGGQKKEANGWERIGDHGVDA